MKKQFSSRRIRIFTPSFADADNTNAQNLTVKEIVSRLPEDRFEITMLAMGPVDERIANCKNVNIVRYRRHGNALRLLAQCLLSQPDIYFFPRCGPLDRGFFELRRRLRLRTALVSYIVMMMTDTTGYELIARSISEADRVFANSFFVAHTVQQKFGRNAETIYDGVDCRCFYPKAREPHLRAVILYAGSFQPRKRVELIIEHAARHPEANFRLAGKGETELYCRRLAEKLGCSNVSFLGHLTPEELGREMREADVFLFPSVMEGHPQVLLQAAASGLPCIAMDLYQPDSIINGETGFLVGSDEELGRRLDVLLKDITLRQAMSRAAILHSAQFNWERVTQQWISVFEEVVNRA